MACCHGSASWFCCYPDPCGCDNCCCQGNNCSAECDSSNYCGVGACCTCNSGHWGFAWKYAGYCGMSPSCGTYFEFTKNCTIYFGAPRVDTGPSSSYMVDLTKSLFMQFAPLSQGVITDMVVAETFSECC